MILSYPLAANASLFVGLRVRGRCGMVEEVRQHVMLNWLLWWQYGDEGL